MKPVKAAVRWLLWPTINFKPFVRWWIVNDVSAWLWVAGSFLAISMVIGVVVYEIFGFRLIVGEMANSDPVWFLMLIDTIVGASILITTTLAICVWICKIYPALWEWANS